MTPEELQIIRKYRDGEYLMDDSDTEAEKLNRYCAALLTHIAAMTAERDELRAKLDEYSPTPTVRFVPSHIERELSALRKWKASVPVEAIIVYRANSDESEGMIRNGDHEAFADFAESMRTLDAWIETQVQP